MEAEPLLQQLCFLLASLDAASAPPALLAPRRRALEEVAKELQSAAKAAANAELNEASEQVLRDRQAEMKQLLEGMMKEVAGEPWHSPPAQRRLLGFERSLREAAEELTRSIRTLAGPEKQFKYVRPVNMNDPEDVRVSGMAADPPSRVEPDRLGDHHGALDLNARQALGIVSPAADKAAWAIKPDLYHAERGRSCAKLSGIRPVDLFSLNDSRAMLATTWRLIVAVQDEDVLAKAVRYQQVVAGPLADEHTKILASQIGGDRRSAAMLVWMGEAGAQALASQLGEDCDNLAHRMAMTSLLASGSTGLQALHGALGGSDPLGRQNAAEALATAGEEGSKALVDRLNDPSADVRLSAAWGLSRIPKLSRTAALALAHGLEDAAIRTFALQALSLRGDLGAFALATQLASEQKEAQQAAAAGLQKLGEVGARGAAEMLSHQSPSARRRAVELLASMGPDAARALAPWLRDAHGDHRRRAAEAMGRLGEAAAREVKALSRLLEDPDPYARVSAARALRTEGIREAATAAGISEERIAAVLHREVPRRARHRFAPSQIG
ncbi:unnamed protein product [Symbiodinium pilosum]|uniref:HEAT repeat domain-containing protein n=1 Tax=Symbiodinium pilosum TaxID=2952 RepID=A0A812LV69_SYMPI|nr:unnamed protein product [Symbiodinium pilosum]